jgi:AcrR family transcriptional regulator
MSRDARVPHTEGPVEGGATIARATGKSNESRDTLNRERVVRAAMDLADESGIESVTMRVLGRKLGVEAASLYNHVAGKDDLLDALVDLVVAEIDLPSGDVGWHDAMRRRAVSAREVFAVHRWAAGLIDSRGRSGPSSLAYADRVLGVLLEAGFSPGRAANAFLALDSYVYGFERQRSNIAPADDEDATEVAQEVLSAIPDGAYPSLARVAMEYAVEAYDDAAAFDFGLDLILEGLGRLLE